jgi:hypothetical protein
MPTIIRVEYLSYYNVSRNSDKLFNVFLIRSDDGTYSCLTENGRRGSNLVRRAVCEKVRRETAEQRFWEKVRDKRNHPDTPYTNEILGNSHSQIASQYDLNLPTESEVQPSHTQTGQLKENVIAFPVEKINNQPKHPKPGGILNSDQFNSLEI